MFHGKLPFLIGNASSNGRFSIVMLFFWGAPTQFHLDAGVILWAPKCLSPEWKNLYLQVLGYLYLQ